jgi:hypothetical protein
MILGYSAGFNDRDGKSLRLKILKNTLEATMSLSFGCQIQEIIVKLGIGNQVPCACEYLWLGSLNINLDDVQSGEHRQSVSSRWLALYRKHLTHRWGSACRNLGPSAARGVMSEENLHRA